MSPPRASHVALLAKLRGEVADRVVERAAIIAEACGVSYDEADRLAYEQEARPQRVLPGVTT